MNWRWRVGALSAVAGLILALILTLVDSRLSPQLNDPSVHVVLIGLSILIMTSLGALTLRVHWISGSYQSLALGAAFLGFAAIYLWHGVFTENGHPFAFLIYGPTARLAFALAFLGFALSGSLDAGRRFAAILGVCIGAVVIALVGFVVHDPLSSWATGQNAARFLSIRLSVEGIALAALVAGLGTLVWSQRTARMDVPAPILAAVVFLMWQSIFFMVTSAWTLTWWAAHALGAGSTILLAGTVIVQAQTHEKNKELNQASEMNRLKTNFINTAAHELATPLTPIMLQIRVLAKDAESMQPGQQRFLQILQQNLNRLNILVRRILEGAKSLAGKLDVHHDPYDLAEALSDLYEPYHDLAHSQDISLSLDVEPPMPTHGDMHRIQQVIANALDNAIKYTPAGGSIHCSLQRDGDDAVIKIRDTGAGLSPELQTQLFQPFAKGPLAGKEVPGSGLGLFLSRQIVEAMHGTMIAKSQGEGHGTTVEIRLPLHKPILHGDP